MSPKIISAAHGARGPRFFDVQNLGNPPSTYQVELLCAVVALTTKPRSTRAPGATRVRTAHGCNTDNHAPPTSAAVRIPQISPATLDPCRWPPLTLRGTLPPDTPPTATTTRPRAPTSNRRCSRLRTASCALAYTSGKAPCVA